MRHGEHELLEALLEVLEKVRDYLGRLVQSKTAVLSKENDMAFEVGATETVTLTFVDAQGAAAAPPKGDGSGLEVTITSDNTAVATVGATSRSGNTAVATATAVAPGSFNYTATVANTSGAALVDDDGTTPFVQPAALAGEVTAPPPPQATTATLSAS